MIEIDEYEFDHYIGQAIADYDLTFDKFNNRQDSFKLYLFFTKELSWDIDSALAHDCTKDPDWNNPDIMYEPNPEDPTDKRIIDHFKELHGLDLLDPTINWSFDT